MDELVLPPGFKCGCLPRVTAFGTCCKPMADEIEEIPRDQWPGLIGTVSLRPRVRQVLNQGSNGSCATESTTQGVMVARDVAGLPFDLLNPLSIYRFTNGGSDNGSNIDSNLVHARDVGILPESYWPRSKGWRASPPDGWKEVAKRYRIREFFDIASIGEAGTALLKGYGVVFGWNGHSCMLTTLLSPTTAEYINSWGAWGDKGFGKINLASINLGYGMFAVTAVEPTGA
jgi:hypothetical protein